MFKHESFAAKWPILEEIVNNVIDMNKPTPAEFMTGYTVVYDARRCDKCAEQYYGEYEKTLQDYIYSKVLPPLAEKKGEIFLKELLQQWNTYKTLHKWLFKMFQSLDEYYTRMKQLPNLVVKCYIIFNNTVLGRINDFQVRDTLISEINRERNGEEIDHALMKNAVKIYLEIDENVKNAKRYEFELETEIVKATSQFYSRKGKEWFHMTLSAASPLFAYEKKIRESLNEEETRVSNYLADRSLGKLFQAVSYALEKVYERQMHEMRMQQKNLRTDDDPQ